MPADKRTFTRQLQPDTRYIGVVAAFRDLEQSQWRAAAPVPAGRTVPLVIQLEGKKIFLSVQ